MDHLSKALLARYSLSPDAIRPGDEKHLEACAACRQALTEERDFNVGLAQPDSWMGIGTTVEMPPGFGELRRAAEIGPEEDAAAEEILLVFDRAPAARFAWEDLPSDKRFRSGGVVRALCKRANDMCGRDPRYALALAKAASRIAEALPSERYSANAMNLWRAEAHKERANALFLLGRFRETMFALDAADSELAELDDAGVISLAVLYIRAKVLYEQDDLAQAEKLAERAASAALHLAEEDRFMSARNLMGNIRFVREDFERAAAIFESILRYGERVASPFWIVRGALTLGNTQIELGRLRDARRSLDLSLRRSTELQLDVEVTRTRWAFARLLFAEGATGEGMQRMRATIAELNELEMLTDGAIASVDLAEMMSTTNRVKEIPRLLDGVVETFTRAGKLTGALTALAYVKEAAIARKLTKPVTRHVQRFLGRTEYQPQLLFVAPGL